MEPVRSHQGKLCQSFSTCLHMFFLILVKDCSYAFYNKGFSPVTNFSVHCMSVPLKRELLLHVVYMYIVEMYMYYLQNLKTIAQYFPLPNNIDSLVAICIFLHPRSGHILSIHSFKLARWFSIATLRITLQR